MHLFSKLLRFWSVSLVDFQLSQLYVRNGMMLELKSLHVVLFVIIFNLQMFVSLLNASGASAVRTLIMNEMRVYN